MRVEVVESLPKRDEAGPQGSPDVAVERALKNFFGAIGSDDSLFGAENRGVQLNDGANEKVCSGTLVVKYRDEKLVRSRGAHISLLEKLSGLLQQAGSTESLSVFLALRQDGQGAQQEFALDLRLDAKGSSLEQAGLRWGLGLAHVQQALLFASRLLRQRFTQSGD